MKISCNEAMVHGESILEKAKKIKAWGYDAMSLMPNGTLWKDEKTEELKAALDETGLELTMFTLMGMDFGHLAEDEGEGVEKSVRLGCRSVDVVDYINSGFTVQCFAVPNEDVPFNRTYPEAPQETFDRFVKHMGRVCNHAQVRNREVYLEPCNRYESKYCNLMEHGVKVIEATGRPNTGLVCDLFHAGMEEADLIESIKKYGKYIKLYHIADSNRRLPGCGCYNWDEIFSAIKSTGYDGYLELEAAVFGDEETELKRTAEFLRKYM